MYQADPLLYRENERAKVQLSVIRHLPHEANLLHVYFDMQVRCVCKVFPAGHLGLSEFAAEQQLSITAVNPLSSCIRLIVPRSASPSCSTRDPGQLSPGTKG